MNFHARSVSASVAGDYYQVVFEQDSESIEDNSPYLLIQRQFEFQDGGKCYIETHDEKYRGDFRLRNIEFKADGIVVDLDRSRNANITVSCAMEAAEFEHALQVLEVIIGRRPPLDE